MSALGTVACFTMGAQAASKASWHCRRLVCRQAPLRRCAAVETAGAACPSASKIRFLPSGPTRRLLVSARRGSSMCAHQTSLRRSAASKQAASWTARRCGRHMNARAVNALPTALLPKVSASLAAYRGRPPTPLTMALWWDAPKSRRCRASTLATPARPCTSPWKRHGSPLSSLMHAAATFSSTWAYAAPGTLQMHLRPARPVCHADLRFPFPNVCARAAGCYRLLLLSRVATAP